MEACDLLRNLDNIKNTSNEALFFCQVIFVLVVLTSNLIFLSHRYDVDSKAHDLSKHVCFLQFSYICS